MQAPEDEDSLLRWLRGRLARERKKIGEAGELPDGELLGDDAAKIAARADLAITMDSQIEGVHFFPGLAPEIVAERALAVNLSDLAAMGAAPKYAFLSLTAPPHFGRRAFFRSFLRCAGEYGLTLAGGDLSKAPQVHVVLTLLGERRGRFLERSGAAPGEVIYVGGEIGVSGLGLRLIAAGAALSAGGRAELPAFLEKLFHPAARRALRRHLLPRPQIDLGLRLATREKQGAALDVSDGLAKDLHRLCRESRVGAVIDAAALPMPADCRRLAARLGEDWLALALGAGEDYVLLFTLPPEAPPPAGAVAIGRIVRGRRISLLQDGHQRPLPPLGFDHLA